jgi:hypothetical protein
MEKPPIVLGGQPPGQGGIVCIRRQLAADLSKRRPIRSSVVPDETRFLDLTP